jgi:hypothetical protein
MREEGGKKRRRERDLPTKGAAKMRLIDRGVGFWTKHDGEWCVRIAGEFKVGDCVRVMANAGRIAKVVLGDPVPNTSFQWRNSEGERVNGQLFRKARTQDIGKNGGGRGETPEAA